MSAARGLKVNWGVGAGRALAVREPPSEFIAQLQKTVDAREAAARMFAESGLTAEVVNLKPAFDAVVTYNTIKSNGEPLTEMDNFIFSVTTVEETPPETITAKYVAKVVDNAMLWNGTRKTVRWIAS